MLTRFQHGEICPSGREQFGSTGEASRSSGIYYDVNPVNPILAADRTKHEILEFLQRLDKLRQRYQHQATSRANAEDDSKNMDPLSIDLATLTTEAIKP